MAESLEACVFCKIVKTRPATVIFEDELTMAFMDLRQFHSGHVLVIPRAHLQDIRELDPITGAALIETLVRVVRAVDASFPSDGMSVWHSVGEGANQEVPHLHLHVHPRSKGDDVLRVYPSSPATPPMAELEKYAAVLRERISDAA